MQDQPMLICLLSMKTKTTMFRAWSICFLLNLGFIRTIPAADVTFTDDNWSSMGGFPGANGEVFAAVIDGSGTLYIGGDFTVVGDVIANGIAKWDGTNWSALETVKGTFVSALAVVGSDLYAGGYITTADGIAANIAKWDGSYWSML